MQVPVCGTGWGLENNAGFVVLVLVVVVVVPSPCLAPGPAHNRISLQIGSDHDPAATHPTFRFPCFGKDLHSSCKIKHDLLLQGEARAEAGAGADAGAEAGADAGAENLSFYMIYFI